MNTRKISIDFDITDYSNGKHSRKNTKNNSIQSSSHRDLPVKFTRSGSSSRMYTETDNDSDSDDPQNQSSEESFYSERISDNGSAYDVLDPIIVPVIRVNYI